MTCNPGSFFTHNSANQSYIQQIAYLSTMSKEDYERAKADGGMSAQYGLIGGSYNYNDFREKLQTEQDVIQFSKYEKYHISWSTSALDQFGLDGYKRCLEAEGGFFVTVTRLDDESANINVVWLPPVDGRIESPTRVLQSHNIENVQEIDHIFGAKPWLGERRDLDVVARKQNKDASATLVIGGGHKSTTSYLPPPIIEQPPAPDTASYVQTAQYFARPPVNGVLNCQIIYGGEFVSSIATSATRLEYNFLNSGVVVVHPGGALGNLPMGRYRVIVEYASADKFDGIGVQAGADDQNINFPSTGGTGMAHRGHVKIPRPISFTAANPLFIMNAGARIPDIRLFIFYPV